MFKSHFLIIMVIIALVCPLGNADENVTEDPPFASDDAKYSYVLGAQFAYTLQKQGVANIDIEMMTRALHDVLENKPMLMTDEEIQAGFQEFRQKAIESARMKRQAEAQAHLEAGQKFLEDNKTKEGIQVTESGLQYKVITEGTGISPDADDKVTVHYRGTLINGTEFDSSYKKGKPFETPLNRVVKGWTEGLQLMKEGAKVQFFIPSNLGYGTRGQGPSIPPNSVLIFEVELLKVTQQDAPVKVPSSRTRPRQ